MLTQSGSSAAFSTIEVKLYGNELVQASFTELFQKGFLVRGRAGATIREVVTGLLGVEREYLDCRINTVFLNGEAVDDVDQAKVGKDAALSLSASMPGFVGAALRKGGFYAVMRTDITHSEDQAFEVNGAAAITVRLYNLVARELGPRFLRSGVRFRVQDLLEFLRERSERFWRACNAISVNDQQVDAEHLKRMLQDHPAREALLFVHVLNQRE